MKLYKDETGHGTTMIEVSKEKLSRIERKILKRYIIEQCLKVRLKYNLQCDYDVDIIEKDLYDQHLIDSRYTDCYYDLFCKLSRKHSI